MSIGKSKIALTNTVMFYCIETLRMTKKTIMLQHTGVGARRALNTKIQKKSHESTKSSEL